MGQIVRKVRRGDELLASDWNAVADNINETIGAGVRSRRRTFIGVNGTGATIPAKGVATLGTALASPTVPVINLVQAGEGAIVAILGDTPNTEQSPVHIVDNWAPTQVLCSDATVVAGDIVGPVSGSFQVGKSGSGLIAVTDHEAGLVWVISADGGGGKNQVALTETIIPARSNLVPGGPITVTRQKLSAGSFVDDGTVGIYSWVNSPSKDPSTMTNPNGKLFIFIEEDEYGITWWTGEDCDPAPPPVELMEGILGAPTPVVTAPTILPGTTISPSVTGIHTYSANIEVAVTGLPGGQTWTLTVDLWNSTDSVALVTWTAAGTGTPLTNQKFNYTRNINIPATSVGDALDLRVTRAAGQGTITAQPTTTWHQLTGPLV